MKTHAIRLPQNIYRNHYYTSCHDKKRAWSITIDPNKVTCEYCKYMQKSPSAKLRIWISRNVTRRYWRIRGWIKWNLLGGKRRSKKYGPFYYLALLEKEFGKDSGQTD